MKLSPLMQQVLVWIHEGHGSHHNCRGMSAHGGRAACLAALSRRKLIYRDSLTEAGIKEVKRIIEVRSQKELS